MCLLGWPNYTDRMVPQTQYARAGSVHIAYQVFGEGPVDLVLVPGWVSNVDVFWDEPIVARFLQGLAAFCRVILFDKRGTGLSDRVTDTPLLEDRMDDVRAVMDAVGSRQAVLAGYSEGGPMCLLFASTWPERTRALVTIGSYARRRSADDYPFGLPPAADQHILDMIREGWGGPMDIDIRAPTLSTDQRFCRWWARYLRAGASPASILALHAANSQIDVRPVLSAIRVPTLVLHATHDQTIPVESSRYLAEHIPGASLVEAGLPGPPAIRRRRGTYPLRDLALSRGFPGGASRRPGDFDADVYRYRRFHPTRR